MALDLEEVSSEGTTAQGGQQRITQQQIEDARAEVQRPFPQEEELRAKEARLSELNALLNLDEKDAVLLDDAEPEEERDEKALCVAER